MLILAFLTIELFPGTHTAVYLKVNKFDDGWTQVGKKNPHEMFLTFYVRKHVILSLCILI